MFHVRRGTSGDTLGNLPEIMCQKTSLGLCYLIFFFLNFNIQKICFKSLLICSSKPKISSTSSGLRAWCQAHFQGIARSNKNNGNNTNANINTNSILHWEQHNILALAKPIGADFTGSAFQWLRDSLKQAGLNHRMGSFTPQHTMSLSPWAGDSGTPSRHEIFCHISF